MARICTNCQKAVPDGQMCQCVFEKQAHLLQRIRKLEQDVVNLQRATRHNTPMDY